jgi:hypothetical protein
MGRSVFSDELSKLQNLFDTPWLTHDLSNAHAPAFHIPGRLQAPKEQGESQVPDSVSVRVMSDSFVPKHPQIM